MLRMLNPFAPMVLCLKTRESRSLPDLPNIPPPFTQLPIILLCSYAELFFILISLRLRYMLPYGVTYAWCLPKRIFHILRYMLPYGVTYTFNHAQSISHTLTPIRIKKLRKIIICKDAFISYFISCFLGNICL